jgi:hypothetical protein
VPTTDSTAIDAVMLQASQALARMDYLTCEERCLHALAQARAARDWTYYARVLLPLQESRRHRRMLAAEGLIRLGTTNLPGSPADWLDQCHAGCVVVTRPHTAAHAAELHDLARARRRYLEVLWADSDVTDFAWTLRSFRGSPVTLQLFAPPPEWRDRWLPAREFAGQSPTPADWFIDRTEALGNAALQGIEPGRGLATVQALEQALEVFTDHEILHQRLQEAVRQMAATPVSD